MSTPVRVAAFVTALAAVFALALGLGRVVGPIATEPAEAAHGSTGHAEHADDEKQEADHLPGGLMVADGGYRLELDEPELAAGGAVPLRFKITDTDGEPLTSYDVAHEKELHLIVVRRDLAGYQHLHPVRESDGTWTTDVALTPGSWRVIADFVPQDGEPLTLGADLAVPGRAGPAAPTPDAVVATVDGYTVTLSGELAPSESVDLTVRVQEDGEDVTDLEPYLGAYGHLVALREGDLAYLHVHPEESGPGPDVPFVVEVPSAGDYRLYFDFQHDGVVRTAELAVSTEEGHSHDH